MSLSNKELLDKCKEIIAKKYCYRSWDHYMANEWDSDSKERSLYDQVCELYATEKAKELFTRSEVESCIKDSLEAAAENAKIKNTDPVTKRFYTTGDNVDIESLESGIVSIDKSSITDTKNIKIK